MSLKELWSSATTRISCGWPPVCNVVEQLPSLIVIVVPDRGLHDQHALALADRLGSSNRYFQDFLNNRQAAGNQGTAGSLADAI
jgi:hypothetical protein